MSENTEHVVIINGTEMVMPTAKVTGIQIRLLAQLPSSYVLIVEGVGSNPDQLLSDTDEVDLSKGVRHLYFKPPTAFGGLV